MPLNLPIARPLVAVAARVSAIEMRTAKFGIAAFGVVPATCRISSIALMTRHRAQRATRAQPGRALAPGHCAMPERGAGERVRVRRVHRCGQGSGGGGYRQFVYGRPCVRQRRIPTWLPSAPTPHRPIGLPFNAE